MREADKLVQNGVIREKEDIYYHSIITQRKEEYEVYEKLTPRVMTSEGEVLSGAYDTGNIPKGALAGIPVSSGIIKGRARVILKMEDANIEEGDFLVTVTFWPSQTSLPITVSPLKGSSSRVGVTFSHPLVQCFEVYPGGEDLHLYGKGGCPNPGDRRYRDRHRRGRPP
ncbi:pyruvate, water dikinase [Desulfosporosinus lacus DSM 15449]|uniref:Pyruvate, water dikinase n=1 Tax=Desulfosporosinus lacus DSM 15449 TaxID=1121420 RepID=A0A1M5X917_9FIRM|nr:pyruvate, water dikinase [Desulfosporosinus lacus DSM 15449]